MHRLVFTAHGSVTSFEVFRKLASQLGETGTVLVESARLSADVSSKLVKVTPGAADGPTRLLRDVVIRAETVQAKVTVADLALSANILSEFASGNLDAPLAFPRRGGQAGPAAATHALPPPQPTHPPIPPPMPLPLVARNRVATTLAGLRLVVSDATRPGLPGTAIAAFAVTGLDLSLDDDYEGGGEGGGEAGDKAGGEAGGDKARCGHDSTSAKERVPAGGIRRARLVMADLALEDLHVADPQSPFRHVVSAQTASALKPKPLLEMEMLAFPTGALQLVILFFFKDRRD